MQHCCVAVRAEDEGRDGAGDDAGHDRVLAAEWARVVPKTKAVEAGLLRNMMSVEVWWRDALVYISQRAGASPTGSTRR